MNRAGSLEYGVRDGSRGISIGELVMVVLIISILAIIIVPRFFNVTQRAEWEVDLTNMANVNALVQLYYIKESTWPVDDLSDIGTNVDYFPEATLPSCPVTSGAAYTLDPSTHRVTGHLRNDPTHP
ncbi:MAG: hypothetical protein AB1742_08940 [bacterium]